MKQHRLLFLFISFSACALTLTPAHADAKGTSGGRLLIDAPSARAAALGEAFTAATDDVSGGAYNPASLASLTDSQASMLYQKGIVDDTSAHFLFGRPSARGGWGLSAAYYNAGTINLIDDLGQQRSVNAQTDMALAATFARNFGSARAGMSLKYISSTIVETDKATAYAADFGGQIPLSERITAGAALQNIGTKLTYVDGGDDLARLARAGLAMKLGTRVPVGLFLDAIDDLTQKTFQGAAGVEVGVGPLALRAGYRSGLDLEALTLGAGFHLGKLALDYSFGMVDTLDNRHRVSITYRWGAAETSPTAAATIPMLAEAKR